MHGGMRMYVISYDISNDRLRNRISKTLEGYGQRVQYSVFECEITEKQFKKLYRGLLTFMSELGEEEGSIRIYALCGACVQKRILLGIMSNSRESSLFPKDQVIVV